MPEKKHGRGRGRKPHRRHPTSQTVPAEHDPRDQMLFQTLRPALRSGRPLDFLVVISGFLDLTDARSRDQFAPAEGRPRLEDLVESFIAAPYAETTAALTVMRELTTDELLAARIGQELQSRRHPMPEWMTGLRHAQPDPDLWTVTQALGDGDDYLIGVTVPPSSAVSALVYVDHNLGTVVKDAFMISEPLEDVAIKMGTLIDSPGQSLTRTDAATARAVLEAAIDFGAQIYPPLESETWPMCRPLVEWMVRMLPTGGLAPGRREWSEEESADLAEAFFGSSYGAPLDQDDERDLLARMLSFTTSYATGDPLRWNSATVEMLLTDWFPRMVMADLAYYAKLPRLVRAFIAYCHDQLEVPAVLTEATLAAVDLHEPEYLELIHSDQQRAMAVLAAAMLESEEGMHLLKEELDWIGLGDEVGGFETVGFDAEPLPDEEFDWVGIGDEIRPTVQAILDGCDACADAILDVEHRTAMRRFLARAARNDPAPFRRKSSPVRGAAAVAWVICTANRSIGSSRSAMAGKDLLAHFGITGSVSDRAQTLIRAAGLEPGLPDGAPWIGDPGLLVSRRRRQLIDDRDPDGRDPTVAGG